MSSSHALNKNKFDDLTSSLANAEGSIDPGKLSKVLKTILSNEIDVVGLGELTHGMGNNFAIKVEILKILIREHGFRTIGFEMGLFSAMKLNQYILHGKDTVESTLSQLGRMYFNEEMVDLLLWLKKFNDEHPNDRVELSGFDTYIDPKTTQELIKAIGDENIEKLFSDAINLSDSLFHLEFDPAFRENKSYAEILISIQENPKSEELKIKLKEIQNIITENLNPNISAVNLQLLRSVLKQLEDNYRQITQGRLNVRDKVMAENIITLHEASKSGKVALWAHNGHVQKTTFESNPIKWMGQYLQDKLSKKYHAIGFVAHEGKFFGIKEEDGKDIPSDALPLQIPPQGSFEAEIKKSNFPIAFVRTQLIETPVSARLGLGWVEDKGNNFERYNISGMDSVIYIEQARPALNPTAEKLKALKLSSKLLSPSHNGIFGKIEIRNEKTNSITPKPP